MRAVALEQSATSFDPLASALAGPRTWLTSRRRQATLAFVLYAALAIGYFGLSVLPHPGRQCVCEGGDPAVQMWFLVWWQHALLHGHNPFVTEALFAPDHVNLGALMLAPGAAIVAIPITLLFGPVVSYNLVMLASPPLAAFFAFLLCRYVSGSFAAGLIGGYVFGFSTYMLGHMLGHTTLVLTFPIPAAVYLTLLLMDGQIERRRFIALMALSLAALFLFSPELTFTFVLIGAVAFAFGYALAPGSRASIGGALPTVIAAGGLAALVTSPFIYYILTGEVTTAFFAHTSDTFVADGVAFLVPTPLTRLGRSWFAPLAASFSGNLAENGVYVGLPMALIVARYAITRWRSAVTRAMIATLAVLVLLMLGAHLHIAGYPTVPLPWELIDRLPLLFEVIPVRLGIYVFLIIAVMLALWLAQPHSRRIGAAKWAVAVLAVLMLVPNVGSGLWRSRPEMVRFFATAEYRRVLRSGDTVLALPWGPNGYSMLWQAETEMRFRMAGGYLGALVPADYRREPILPAFSDPRIAPTPADLQAFLVRHDVDAAVVDAANPQQWPRALGALGLRPVSLGGVLFYKIPRGYSVRMMAMPGPQRTAARDWPGPTM